ncbi:fimbrial biogenesis outer membrane usher protein [Paraburkholderia dipogonis]|uniref:Fimbrial biogenesis outer membrane usher protein n=2 Tax=Paraburkholderia dipogonis TaxID=1211383 RepID=A0A4Y8NCD7_9BURK|nr:fimbria/pilus outer membrane usher protein [Paraburkholderia dipogonis]TFE47203.1 fimbrial biogenesis outer membrane usher protein [Paraburkholderia dipogonis]
MLGTDRTEAQPSLQFADTGVDARTDTGVDMGGRHADARAPMPAANVDSARSVTTKPAQTSAAGRDLYLEVMLNGQRTSLIAHFRESDGRLSATARDLSDIGVATEKLGAADTATLELDQIPGLRYHYDAGRQSIDLQVPDAIRKPYTFDTRELAQTPNATASRGFLINYDAFAQTDTNAQFALWSEQRYFDPAGVLSNTGIAYLYRDLHRYVRYDTSWSTSNPAALSTTQFGDTISSSLDWSRSIRIGGFQWRSNFALRPDLVTFPVQALSGTAVVPSAVDLYINNVRQFSGNVPSGPFIVNNVPGITGAGEATVITHDALGRTISTSLPLYVDTRMLAAGLSSYSFEAGFLRRGYGIDSFSYDPRPAVSATARRGMSDTLTLEGHAEATGGLVNAGAGALVRMGMAGVINGSVSGSAGKLNGTQLGLGYQLIEPHFSIDAQTLRAYGNYGDLAARDGTPVPTATDRVTLALPFFSRQTLSLSYIGYRYPGVPASRIGSLSYTLNFGNLASLTLSTYKDFLQHNAQGVFLTASFGLGNNTAINASVGRQNGQSTYNVNAQRPPDYAGGWGWGVQAGGSGAVPYRQAQAQYLGRYGEVTALAQDIDRHAGASLDVAGAIVLMDRTVQPARRIDDGFALVATGGVARVPVLHENRVIGTTDRGGHLLIPDLNAYQHNQVGIDSMNLPADARIATTAMDLVPKSRAGVLASFRVSRYSAASVILRSADGHLMPPGTRVHHVESGVDTIVGYDGLTFIEKLQHDNHLEVENDAVTCSVEFIYERPANGSLPTIGPLTCGARGSNAAADAMSAAATNAAANAAATAAANAAADAVTNAATNVKAAQ